MADSSATLKTSQFSRLIYIKERGRRVDVLFFIINLALADHQKFAIRKSQISNQFSTSLNSAFFAFILYNRRAWMSSMMSLLLERMCSVSL